MGSLPALPSSGGAGRERRWRILSLQLQPREVSGREYCRLTRTIWGDKLRGGSNFSQCFPHTNQTDPRFKRFVAFEIPSEQLAAKELSDLENLMRNLAESWVREETDFCAFRTQRWGEQRKRGIFLSAKPDME